jgi:hypothetical protein
MERKGVSSVDAKIIMSGRESKKNPTPRVSAESRVSGSSEQGCSH